MAIRFKGTVNYKAGGELIGLKELKAELVKMPNRIQYNVMRTAIFRGAQSVRDLAKDILSGMSFPYGTGKLQKSIYARRAKGTKTEVRAKVGAPVPYAHLVERGFHHTGGKHVEARPFLTEALRQQKDDILEVIKNGIKTELKKQLVKAQRIK